jgi:hypothetical protein
MARIRSIKPEFWTSSQVMECSRDARLLFIGLWNFCDDHGRHPWSPKQIKALVLPADELSASDVESMMLELEANGLIVRYSANGRDFFAVTGWHHQKIDKRQSAKYPGPECEESASVRRIVAECAANSRGTVSTERKGEEGKGEEDTEDNNRSGLDTAAAVSGDARYAFGGKTIKLTTKDLKAWQAAYPHITVTAELYALDEWAGQQAKWYPAVSAALAKREREAVIAIEQAKATGMAKGTGPPAYRETRI